MSDVSAVVNTMNNGTGIEMVQVRSKQDGPDQDLKEILDIAALSSSSDGVDTIHLVGPSPAKRFISVYQQRQRATTEGDERSNITSDCEITVDKGGLAHNLNLDLNLDLNLNPNHAKDHQPTATLTTTSSMIPTTTHEQVNCTGRKRKSSSNETNQLPQKPGPKRKTSGILNTALGWARSQAAELEAFKLAQQSNGPRRPPPPLPIPTRKLAAAQHDLMKAQQAREQVREQGLKQPSQKSSTDARYQAHGNDIPIDLLKELSRWHGEAQSLAEYYAAMATECRAWAKGGKIPFGLTVEDLDQTKKELKAKFNYCVRDNNKNNKVLEQICIERGVEKGMAIMGNAGRNAPSILKSKSSYTQLRTTPRRSGRARNTKKDDLYVSLEESEEELGGATHDKKVMVMTTPNLNSQLVNGLEHPGREPQHILSPYAQFMLEQGEQGEQGDFLSDFMHPLPENGSDAQDLLDGALEDFISTLNFSNEEEFDIPVCNIKSPLLQQNSEVLKLPGMVPTTLPMAIPLQNEILGEPDPVQSGSPGSFQGRNEVNLTQQAPPNEALPNSVLPAVQPQILGTPTIVRMLTLGCVGDLTSPCLKSPSPIVINDVSPPPLGYFLSAGSPDTVVKTPKVT